MSPLSLWGRVGLRLHKVVVPLPVAHSPFLPILHLGFCLLVCMFQGGGVPPPVHMPREVPVGKWLLVREDIVVVALVHSRPVRRLGGEGVCMWGVVVLVRAAMLVRPWELHPFVFS